MDIDNRIHIRAGLAPMCLDRRISLFCFTATGGQQKPSRAKLLFEPIEERFTPIEPLANIGKEEAQVLMDDLWSAGIRPTEGNGSAGAMTATQRHLSDMRKIAFDRLKIKENDNG